MKRRDFIKTGAFTVASTSFGIMPMDLFAGEFSTNRLTILHTNDVHSRIEPFEGGRNKGRGGVARRATLIQQIRAKEPNVLLLDAGDIFQGTPYFNFFHGEVEMKMMSELGYDAATIGNHDFDAGIGGLEKQLKHANFPLLVANYDFSNTVLNGKTKPYQIFQKGNLKIGVFGVGIELESLVPQALYLETQYLNPLPIANEIAGRLKHDEKCDFVICLSHLGYKYKTNKVSDMVLAEQSKDIDLIIGGHTHTFLKEPTQVENAEGRKILVNQVGFGGLYLGRIDVHFSRNKNAKFAKTDTVLVE